MGQRVGCRESNARVGEAYSTLDPSESPVDPIMDLILWPCQCLASAGEQVGLAGNTTVQALGCFSITPIRSTIPVEPGSGFNIWKQRW